MKDENPVTDEIPLAVPKRGRGRAPKIITTTEMVESFTCGNCHDVVPAKSWKKHVYTHYGLTWREDIDTALDLNDDVLIARVMTQFVKVNKIKYLTCPKCDDKKRSAVGYISHLQICGLAEDELANARVKCEHCGKMLRKVSIQSHIQGFCLVLRAKKQEEEAALRAAAALEQVDEEVKEDDVNVEKESKRRTSRFGRKKKKRIFYDGSVSTTTSRIDDFVKKFRITGGTFIGWNRMLREENIIKCATENCVFTSVDVQAMHIHYK